MDARTPKQVAIWLFICSAMVFATLVVGGVTRLTHSGLSIVEWQPIVGVVPPLNQDEWETTFDKYKKTPEFEKVNHRMSLDEFKGIFWWEYFHRVLGRAIGAAFFIPFLWFLLRQKLNSALTWKLAGIFILGGMQGAMGWYMVKSGLVDDPRVSQYRLTAHLSLAFIIFITMMWVALGLLAERSRQVANVAETRLRKTGFWLVILAFYMVVTGGFVAGIRAGKAYNTFPLMNGDIVPSEIFMIEPWYLNFFNNMATVQFDHRLGAWLLAFVAPWFWYRIRHDSASPRAKNVASLFLFAVAIQVALGIATLLMQVPVALGAAHQGGSMVVFGILLWLNHELRVTPSWR